MSVKNRNSRPSIDDDRAPSLNDPNRDMESYFSLSLGTLVLREAELVSEIRRLAKRLAADNTEPYLRSGVREITTEEFEARKEVMHRLLEELMWVDASIFLDIRKYQEKTALAALDPRAALIGELWNLADHFPGMPLTRNFVRLHIPERKYLHWFGSYTKFFNQSGLPWYRRLQIMPSVAIGGADESPSEPETDDVETDEPQMARAA